jgi:predicted esterase
VSHAEALRDSLGENRYGEVRLELFDGGHQMNRDEFTKAMEWFSESEA